jgi:hypothetical protein
VAADPHLSEGPTANDVEGLEVSDGDPGSPREQVRGGEGSLTACGRARPPCAGSPA